MANGPKARMLGPTGRETSIILWHWILKYLSIYSLPIRVSLFARDISTWVNIYSEECIQTFQTSSILWYPILKYLFTSNTCQFVCAQYLNLSQYLFRGMHTKVFVLKLKIRVQAAPRLPVFYDIRFLSIYSLAILVSLFPRDTSTRVNIYSEKNAYGSVLVHARYSTFSRYSADIHLSILVFYDTVFWSIYSLDILVSLFARDISTPVNIYSEECIRGVLVF